MRYEVIIDDEIIDVIGHDQTIRSYFGNKAVIGTVGTVGTVECGYVVRHPLNWEVLIVVRPLLDD